MENEKVIDTSVETSEQSTNSEGESTESVETESVEDIKARLAKAEELANNYKIRAEKAEKASKDSPKPANNVSSKQADELSQKDLIAFIKADVVEGEDIDEVVTYAKLKRISVADALKSATIKTILSEKREERVTAQATATGTAKRASTKVSDEVLASRASKGEIPESEEDLIRLVRSRKGLK